MNMQDMQNNYNTNTVKTAYTVLLVILKHTFLQHSKGIFLMLH
jgi:hypothetical protein